MDISLKDVIAVPVLFPRSAQYLPHTAGRYNLKQFRKVHCPIVERLANGLMMHGRNAGKKAMAMRIVRHAFEIVHLVTGKNPVQVLVDAIERAGAREETSVVKTGGIGRRWSVDVSPLRRVNKAIYFLVAGARRAAFRSAKTIAECLADELINCASNSINCYAIKKKEETEAVARACR
uniref:Small ribosomal subunit protein uS7 domain-containing protein n=1 Tax=Arcella intermedia TaxID=1963864 RepID=A0A6B2LK34_9EUKA